MASVNSPTRVVILDARDIFSCPLWTSSLICICRVVGSFSLVERSAESSLVSPPRTSSRIFKYDPTSSASSSSMREYAMSHWPAVSVTGSLGGASSGGAGGRAGDAASDWRSSVTRVSVLGRSAWPPALGGEEEAHGSVATIEDVFDPWFEFPCSEDGTSAGERQLWEGM
jgi:hypothetical protein